MVRRWRLIGYFPILYNPPPGALSRDLGFPRTVPRVLPSRATTTRGAAALRITLRGLVLKPKSKGADPVLSHPKPSCFAIETSRGGGSIG
jgi:hypothetical protein